MGKSRINAYLYLWLFFSPNAWRKDHPNTEFYKVSTIAICDKNVKLWKIFEILFVDVSILECAKSSFGDKGGYIIGLLFRLFEFGVVSAIPPIILRVSESKYNTVIAATIAFFGMKFFSKLIEMLSEESTPKQLKSLRESNARLEESNARLEESLKMLRNEIGYCKPFVYQPFDPPMSK